MDSTDLIPEDDSELDDSLPLREMHRLFGQSCTDCRAGYSGREAVFSIALGFKNSARCLPCLAKRLGRLEHELRSQLLEYVHRRECYRRAWVEAEKLDGVLAETPSRVTTMTMANSEPTTADETWNAGDLGCGELVMALRLRMNAMPRGAVIHVTALDPAAPEDLPAWCRLSGHSMVSMSHPDYFIRRKGD